jgi:uncharacterized protein (TIGR03032 family)
MTDTVLETPPVAPPTLVFNATPTLAQILQRLRISLAVVTRQGLCVFSCPGEGEVQVQVRNIVQPRCLYVFPGGFLLGTHNQVITFRSAPQLLSRYYAKDSYDQLYMPQMTHLTGDIGLEEVVYAEGNILAVSQSFGVVAMSLEQSFIPSGPSLGSIPPLTGMAVAGGRLRYASAYATETPDQGIVVDMVTKKILPTTLHSPCAPRFHNQTLWVLQSEMGLLGCIQQDVFQPMLSLAGSLRGLAFHGSYGFVGCSGPFATHVEVLNLKTNASEGSLVFEDPGTEILDVQVLPYRYPKVVGYDQEGDIQMLFDLPSPPKRS